MSIPTVGAFRTDDHHYYMNGEGPWRGATGIVGEVYAKPALIQWAKNETAASAVRNLDVLADLVKRGGTDAAAAWVAKIPDYKRDTAASLGSRVHSLAELIARGADPLLVVDDEKPYVDAYQRWRADAKPTKVKAEQMVFGDGYAGTLDCLCVLGSEVWLLDIKSGKGVYEGEVRMQLAAYAFANFIGQPGDPKKYAMPKVTRYGVLHLRPEQYATGYRIHEFAVTDADYAAFRACVDLTAWKASLNGSKP